MIAKSSAGRDDIGALLRLSTELADNVARPEQVASGVFEEVTGALRVPALD
jgi:hypothetical protein